MTSLLDLATNRKSIREYDSQKIPNFNKIIYAIRVSLEAPSGLNCQPWKFLIINDKNIKRSIRKICEGGEKRFHRKMPERFVKWLGERNITWRKKFLEDAPYLILVFNDTTCPHSIQSTWLSIGYLILALEEQGLASLTYTPSNPIDLCRYLGIPKKYRLETIIPVGYPAKDKIKEERFSIDEKVYINKWGDKLKKIIN